MTGQYQIRYLPTAEQDLEDIFDYIVRDNPAANASVLDKFDEAICRLARDPYLGFKPRAERLLKLGYRILIVGNYLVFYMVKSRTVQIRYPRTERETTISFSDLHPRPPPSSFRLYPSYLGKSV